MNQQSAPLPVIALLNELLTVQGYLGNAAGTSLPACITQDGQYSELATAFLSWQQSLWGSYWEGLVAGTVQAQGNEIANLFADGVTDQATMHQILYIGAVPGALQHADDIASFVATGQPLLNQLLAIADAIEDADRDAVAALTQLVGTLEAQFAQQEDKLTQGAIDAGFDLVAVSVDVAVAVGSEGDVIQPLKTGVLKLAKDATAAVELTDEINGTLGQLEAAWSALDQATTNLARITLVCNRIGAVVAAASTTLTALADFANDWSTVAQVTCMDATSWANDGSAALQEWAQQMVRLRFGYATQAVTAASVASQERRFSSTR